MVRARGRRVRELEKVIALDLVSGEERWSSSEWTVVAAADKGLLVAADDQYALVDTTSGAELWTLVGPEHASATALGHADGTMFVSIVDDEGHSTVMALQPAA